MTNLFMPRDQKDLDLLSEKPVNDNGKNCLVYAIGDEIFCMDELFGEPFQITNRQDNIYALCMHDNQIWDGGAEGIIKNTMDNSVMARNCDSIRTICDSNGQFFYGGENQSVVRVHKNKGSPLLGVEGYVTSLCGHDSGSGAKQLFASYENKIVQVLMQDEHKINSFDDSYRVYSLCSHEGALYAGLAKRDMRVQESFIVNAFTGDIINKREDTLIGLVSHEGELYDYCAFNYGLKNTMNNNEVLSTDYKVNAAISVPRGLVFHG